VLVRESKKEREFKLTIISTLIYSRRGSIITATQIVFSFNQSVPSIQEISKTLLTAAEGGSVNLLNIIPGSISVNGSGKLYSSIDL